MKKGWISRIVILALMAALLTAGCVYAAPEQATEPPAEETASVEKTYGTESETAIKFVFVNDTGKDIAFLNIRPYSVSEQDTEMIRALQTALIKEGILDDVADGEAGPKTRAAIIEFREKNDLSAEPRIDEELLTLLGVDDGNVLENKEVMKADEQITVYYEADAEAAAEGEEREEQDLLVAFRLADDTITEYILHFLPDHETSIHILMDGSIPYVQYQAEGSDEVVSTLEDETFLRRPTPQDFLTYD